MKRIIVSFVVSLLVLIGENAAWAVPFAKRVSFIQPDGTSIELWGKGDDFAAVFETLDGYTVVFDDAVRAYCYARLAPDGNTFVSSGIQTHKTTGALLGLTTHLRLDAAVVARQAAGLRDSWEQATGVMDRWNSLKNAMVLRRSGMEMAPPTHTTTGSKLGLCLLIDFDDDPATIPQSEIVNFCNADNYTSFGNNGSVRAYFKEVSNGQLDYSNVVTLYVRIPNSMHPKSWYNDPTKDAGLQANDLIKDAMAILKARPDYNAVIAPTFKDLTVNANNQVVAFNVFYAGGNGGVWARGLWPHSWSLQTAGAIDLGIGGKKTLVLPDY